MKRTVKAWRVFYGERALRWADYRTKSEAARISEGIGIAFGWKSHIAPVYARPKRRKRKECAK